MLAYQEVCYYDLKRGGGGVRDLEESYNGLSVNISQLVVLYYGNIVLLGRTDEKRVTISVN